MTTKSNILHAAVLGALLSPALAAQAYADDFNTDTSPLYVITQTADALATFAFDYGTLGIPVAPNTSDNSTIGLKMEANVTSGTANSVTLHTLIPFTGDYVVRFDAWINANGPFPGGGTGSTEFLTMGVGGDSATPNQGTTTGSGGWFAASGEGGASRDYQAFNDNVEQTGVTGQFNAGNTTAANNASHPYYAQFGGIDVGAMPQALLFPAQTGLTGPGTFGFAWREVEMRVDSTGGSSGLSSVSWWIDGLQICTLDSGLNSTVPGVPAFATDGAVTLGYMDIFNSLSDNSQMSFGLIDNLRIGAAAVTTSFGTGCNGAAGIPALAALNTPVLGKTLQLEATNLDPIVPISAMVVGAAALPAPISLQSIGLDPSCELLISFDLLPTFAAAGGTGNFGFAVPKNISLLSLSVYFQCASLDTVATGGFAVSNAIEATLGL
jgi:hypothetical protein